MSEESGAGAGRGAGQSLAASARDLVRGMADRLDIEGVKEALDEIEAAGRRGRLTAEVRSAVSLTAAERGAVEERLRGRFGERLDVVYHVDPELLGGLAVRVGDHYIDGTVAARLAQLRHRLTGAADHIGRRR